MVSLTAKTRMKVSTHDTAVDVFVVDVVDSPSDLETEFCAHTVEVHAEQENDVKQC